MDLGIKGKVAFVEGASSGMGRTTAELLAAEGCKVVVAALASDQTGIDDTVAAIRAAGGEAIGIGADLTVAAEVERAIAQTTATFGAPDIAINNVGGPPSGFLADVTDDQFTVAMHNMVMSMVYLARAVVPHMREQKWGRIVCLNSVGAKEPPPELAHVLVNPSRAAVISLNKSLSNEFAADGITFNTIATGFIATERMRNYMAADAEKRGVPVEDVIAGIAKLCPANRIGKPEEMAATVAFLCSEGAGYVNGELIAVDGGFHRAAY